MTSSFRTLVEVALHTLCSAYSALVTIPFCSYTIRRRDSLVSHLYPGAQLISQHPIISLQHSVLNCEKPVPLFYSFHLGLRVFASSFQLFVSSTTLFAGGVNLFARTEETTPACIQLLQKQAAPIAQLRLIKTFGLFASHNHTC
uniref:Secreted protein n=1 Tax=Plectus sambesii TaxID=2011161 RepID=A0A914VLQ3_9BILA